MRRSLVAAALVLLAAPAAAQQADPLTQQDASHAVQPALAPEATPAPAAQPAEAAPAAAAKAPSLHVSNERIDARLREEVPAERSAQLNQGFIYTVAAVALGVIIALLLLD